MSPEPHCPYCRGRGYTILWQWVGYNSCVPINCEHCGGTGRRLEMNELTQFPIITGANGECQDSCEQWDDKADECRQNVAGAWVVVPNFTICPIHHQRVIARLHKLTEAG